jgi:hypothetical protein
LYGHQIDRNDLNEFLQRENNLLESLVQIYKQFSKFNSTKEGHIQLNKRTCIIESIKFYVENLIHFNQFDLILPAKAQSESSSDSDIFDSEAPSPTTTTNLLQEVQTCLKDTFLKWSHRRKEQSFTYLIDSFIEESKLHANVAKLFTKQDLIEELNEENDERISNLNIHLPKSFVDLLEICLECNISTQMKQIILVYTLHDMANSDISADLHKNISKLINSYATVNFTTNSNSSLSQSLHRSNESGIEKDVSLSTSNILDLAYGFYLVDSQQLENSFKYLRTSDLSFLELFEKQYILNNAVYLKEFKIASEYLWLFQNKIGVSFNTSDQFNDSYSCADKSLGDSSLLGRSKSFMDKIPQHEHIMYQRLVITIYLSNG